MITSNSLTRNLNASLSNEDSTYTFLMPTNRAYEAMYNKIRQNYNFIATTKVQDVAQFASASATNSKTVTVDAEYLADSLTRRQIVRNLIFSNNDAYNQWVIGRAAEEAFTEKDGYLVADLLRKSLRGETVRMGTEEYKAEDLLLLFIKRAFSMLPLMTTPDKISAVVVTVRKADTDTVKVLQKLFRYTH